MKLVYQGPFDAVEIPLLDNLICERGQVVDIPDELAEGFLEQGSEVSFDDKGNQVVTPPEHPNWVRAKPPASTKEK